MMTEDNKLIAAVRARDYDAVRALLERDGDVDQADDQGWSALNWAAATGELAIIRALCEKGANVFHIGKDRRTPYLIALAASRVAAARYLMTIEKQCGEDIEVCSSRQHELRPYCKAYPVKELQRFPAWRNNTEAASKSLTGDTVLFLHQNFKVTRSMWSDEGVVFEGKGEEWRRFCHTELKFRPPSDLDWLPDQPEMSSDQSPTHPKDPDTAARVADESEDRNR